VTCNRCDANACAELSGTITLGTTREKLSVNGTWGGILEPDLGKHLE